MDNTKKLVSDRFNELLKALDLTVTSFSKALGYDRSDKFYNISKGKYFPSFEILQEITNNFVEVDINWLLSGKGSMFFNKNTHLNTHPSTHLDTAKGENETESAILPVINQLLSKIEEKDALIIEQAKSIGALQKEVEMLQKGFSGMDTDFTALDDAKAAKRASVQQ